MPGVCSCPPQSQHPPRARTLPEAAPPPEPAPPEPAPPQSQRPDSVGTPGLRGAVVPALVDLADHHVVGVFSLT